MKLLTEGSLGPGMLGSAISCPWQSIFTGIVKTADAFPQLTHCTMALATTISQGWDANSWIVESLISETSHQKDNLHTPDHNIVLTEASAADTLFMGKLEK